MHMKMQAFIGADMAWAGPRSRLSRALKDISPRLLGQGEAQHAQGDIGKPLSSVDYQLSEMARNAC